MIMYYFYRFSLYFKNIFRHLIEQSIHICLTLSPIFFAECDHDKNDDVNMLTPDSDTLLKPHYDTDYSDYIRRSLSEM